MKRVRGLGVVMVFSAAAVCAADSIDFGGWRANWIGGGVLDITVDLVTPEFALIEISKDFTEPPMWGVFPPRIIDFVQIAPDANTVPRIIIVDEIITNLTGVDWTDYHWKLLNSGDAWFNVPLSWNFDVQPFQQKLFSDPGNVFNDPNKTTDLEAFDGVVPPYGSFFPGLAGGYLVIDIDLQPGFPVSFTFKQYPTPEPASFFLLGAGALLALRRRG